MAGLVVFLCAIGYALGQVPQACRAHATLRFDLEKCPCVSLLQAALNARVPPLTLEDPSLQLPLMLDGIFASETAKAVKAFQQRWSIGVDDVARPGTLAFLFPDQPLVQLIQLHAQRVHEVSDMIAGEVAAQLSAILQAVKTSLVFGSTLTIFGKPSSNAVECLHLASATVSTLVIDAWEVAGLDVNFTASCRGHKSCYAQSPHSKEHRFLCDETMWKELLEVCEGALGAGLNRHLLDMCQAWTAIYFAAARRHGSDSYLLMHHSIREL
jgi:hypothetical protein